ncbi:MAG: hypothetical protein AAB480_00225 [Patescibacteria group bacterium]
MKKTVLAVVLAVLALGFTVPANAQSAQELTAFQHIRSLDVQTFVARQAQAEACTWTPTQAKYFECLQSYNRSIAQLQQEAAIAIAKDIAGKK